MSAAGVIEFDAARGLAAHSLADDGLAPWRALFRGLRMMRRGGSRSSARDEYGTGRPVRTLPVTELLDLTHDAVCICSLDGVIEYCNRAAQTLYGWTAAEAAGRVGHALFKTIFPAPLDRIEAQLLDTGHWEGELVRTLRDGTRVTIASRWALQRDEAGAPVAIVEAGCDITDRKRFEAEWARLEERLRQAERMEVIGRFASGIAHDFNNILGAILGYGEIAQRKACAASPVDEELDQVMQAGHRGRHLVEHILAFSGSPAAERVPVHVQSVVDETLGLLAASLPAGIHLEHELRAGDAALAGDATRLHQVAMNLCTNAVKATPPGGVVSVRLDRVAIAEARALSHGTLQPGEHVRLQVSDTGSGIPRALQDRIFEPFFTTNGVGKGTGLGLALVQGIVADWHGAVEVASREGAGTTFTVWLPACGETAALPAAEHLAELVQGQGESVMIVDDEPALVRIAEETLAQLGYDPAGFHSGAAALAAFRAEPERYDVVLTDETMPGLAGTELAVEIRKLRADVPIMLMSGHRGEQLSAGARAAGVVGILYKPFLGRAIAESLARALAARRGQADRLAPGSAPGAAGSPARP